MADLANPLTHTDALAAKLTAAGLVVGDGEPPAVAYGWQGAPGQSVFIGYVIVYPLDRSFDGPLGCPDDHGDLGWQVTCVGASRQQCEALVRDVDAALIGQSLTVTGRSVPRTRADEGAGAVRRDDDGPVPLFIATPHYRAVSYPA